MATISDLIPGYAKKLDPAKVPTSTSSQAEGFTWQITDGSFKGFVFHVAIPTAAANFGMTSQEVKTERRLQISEKPGLDGAQVEDFGRKARMFTAEVIFYTNDYQDQLKDFEKVLNQGTSGTLILPDVDEAVRAKFMSESRRTTTETCTILSLQFIEDNVHAPTVTLTAAQFLSQAALAANNPTEAVPTILSLGAQIQASAKVATELLNNNPVISAIQAANASIVGQTSTINSVLNIGRVTRQNIISLYQQTVNNLAGLQNAISSVMNFASVLAPIPGSSSTTNSQAIASATNSGLSLVDYNAVTQASTASVNGVNQVVNTQSTQVLSTVASLSDGQSLLESILATLQGNRQALETETSGNTSDYTAQAINMENLLIDMIGLIAPPPSVNVFSTVWKSLVEICAENGLDPSAISTVYTNNTQLEDILAIPPYTVISIPSYLVVNA